MPTPQQQEGTLLALAHLGLGAVAMTHADPLLADVGHHAEQFYAATHRALARHRLEHGQRIPESGLDPSGRIAPPELTPRPVHLT